MTDITELARMALAAMESETVEYGGIYRPRDAVGVFNVGCETCPDHLVAWTVKGQNLPAGNYWLYISQKPAPIVPDGLLSMAASAIEDLLEHTDPNTSYYSGVWADVPGKLRAAMIAAAPQEVK
ncbi:hypothetical protein [Raoultella planticola]|uniref:hypothetical protein n=1 Tax=Raoultella planticola TaxID=575 RepID=UPI003B6D1324|nr:hypothetical protein [Klebsiella pneumoniae]